VKKCWKKRFLKKLMKSLEKSLKTITAKRVFNLALQIAEEENANMLVAE
jgi:hypothetical protein